MNNISKLKDLLLELKEVSQAEYIKSVESAVTTAWGEEVWDHDKLSRDCLLNMVDGCVEANIGIDKIIIPQYLYVKITILNPGRNVQMLKTY